MAGCRMTVAPHRWAFAEAHQAEIAAHWDAQTAANPSYFNGTVLMLSGYRLENDAFVATAFATEFRNYLYWRRLGFPPADAIDGFGSAVIRAADGSVLLARQRSGQMNAGLFYLPGGFIDNRDVGADGCIDIAASVSREVVEETGLQLGEFEVQAGFVVTRLGAQLSIGVMFRSSLDRAALEQKVQRHIDSDPHGELEAVRFVSTLAELEGVPLADYCVPLLPALLA